MDANTFICNRSAWTAEQLEPYRGRHVAWSADGTAVLADAETLDDLFARVDERGLTGYVTEYVEAEPVTEPAAKRRPEPSVA